MNLQNIEAIYPLSPFQASLLSGDLRALDPSAYCGQMICSLHGQLDSEVFERAWRMIINQYPILRTSFAWENLEKPVQLVHRQIEFSLFHHDWSGLSPEQQQELLNTLIEAEREAGFHASQAPLMRLCLCCLSNDDYYLLWSYDLLVLDNWSLPLLLEKVIALYEGQLKGEIPQVEQGRLYQDYIAWLKEQDITQAEAFWKESLNGLNGSENLNGLFRSTHATANGYAHIRLPSGFTASLRKLASGHQLDFQALVQGAWALLLSRYSGEREIVYGATVSGRPADLTGASLMIGPFSNVLPVHVRVSSSTPAVSWLKSLSAQFEDLRKYSFYPVTRWSGNNGSASHLPAFGSTVEIESSASNGILHENGASLHVRQIQTVEQTKSPLMLIAPSQSEATLQLSYNPAAFDDASAARLTQHFENLLTGILQHPQLPISQLSILSAPELDQLLYSFNDTTAPLPQTSIHALFQQQVLQSPDAVALSFLDSSLTYLELDRRSNQLAHHLLSLGVSPDSLVAVCLDRSLEVFIALLAILKAGAAYLPLDPSYPLARLSLMLADAGSPLLLTTDALADELPTQWTPPLLLDADWDQIALNTDEPLPETVVAAEQLAYVMYTSGSTGTPKGVAVTHAGVLRLVTTPNYVRLDSSQTLLQLAPLTFDASTLEVWGALLNGGRLVVMPPGVPALDELSRVIVAERVTTLWLSAGLFQLMVDEQLEGLSPVAQLLAGGDVLSVRHVEKYLAAVGSEQRLINGYGPTENTTFTCCHVMDENTRLNGSVPIGRPITNTQVYVLDAELQVVPLGVVGELYIGGAGLARGYFKQPELTAERFVPHPYSGAGGERLYRTGDMVRWHQNGALEFIGRVDGQVKIRGFRIEVGEIEAVLAGHAGVREAVVLVREDERGDKRLAAYVVKAAEVEATAGELKEYLRARLPEYMQVQWVVAVAELPLTANGKVDRRGLQGLAVELADSGESERVLARTPAEEILAAIWGEVLGRETVSVHDNFFELGGHSLLATQVIARVRDAFGQEVALRSLFEQPTVAGLAREMEVGRGVGAELQAPPLVPISRELELPLSFAQQRLWFLDQLEAGGSFYNLPAAVRLRGELDVAALERTLSEIIRRHEALRTTFAAVDGRPVQLIKPFTPVVLPVFDVSELNAEEREAETRRLLSEEGSRPFDLARGPLVRVCLVRAAADEHVALLTMHHIISDGWSAGVFIREVSALYSAYVRGAESPLEELAIQYADFAHWQRSWLQGEVLAAQVRYWREALAEAPAMLELPGDHPRPREQTFNGAVVAVMVPEELTQQLKWLSQRERVTLFMTLLAAFQSLLYRHSGQDDIVVGTPIANRRYRELEDLIGFFVNTLALRASSLARLTFTGLLHRVREVTLGAYAHQDLPFEKLVEEMEPERDLSRNPIFQVMFALQNAPSSVLELPGLRLEAEGVESGTTRFDLECHLWEAGEALAGVFVYNTELFEQTTVERLVVNFATLLQSITTDATAAVTSLRLLRAADERQLLYDWNETWTDSPQAVVQELFAQQVERTPDRTAVVFEEVRLTYAELHRRSNLLASYLQSKGVGADTVVGVMLERSVEMLVAVLGVLKAGGAYLPLDPEYPSERLQFMLQDAQVRVLLTQEQLAESIGIAVEIIRLNTNWDAIIAEAVDEDQHAEVTSDNLAYVIYTSGSTGQPKGVAMTHRPLVNLLHWQMHRSTNAPRTLQFTSLSFDVSFQEIFSTWCAGGTLVLMREEARRDAGELWRLLIGERIERLFLPFVALQYLAEASEHNEAYPVMLREVITAGEQLKITRQIRRLFAKLEGCTLDNQYGPSETHVVSALMLEGDAAAWPELPAIGRPIANAQLCLLDEHLQVVPIGVAGELYLGGEVLARGYLNRAAESAEKFLPHPFTVDGTSRLYRTGDRARYLGDGNIEFLGRRDQQVKVRGYRIELGEVEAALRRQQQVREAVVVSSAAATGENRLIAYVLTEPDTTLSTSALRGGLKELLPEYMVPAVFVLLEEFPLTPSGKIDRRALQGRPVEFEAGGARVLARTPAEEIVAAIWSEVLGRAEVGVHDNFFELGGHSLLATQVISRVRDAFRQEVALRRLFEQPTVAGLVQSIEQQQRAGAGLLAPPLVRITEAERLPLSFAQQRLWFLDQMEPGSVAYNMPAVVRLKGRLDVEALQRTLDEVARRHEVLRTTFVTVNGEAVQVIAPAGQVKLPVLDLSELPEEQREAEAQQMAAAEAAQPFDLSVGPLLRVQLLRMGEEDHVVLFTMHHIITDGWSTGILVSEVSALYEAYIEGRESPLAELEIQYADYAVWQREWLQGEVLEQQLSYWREQLGGELPVLQLPTDKPRPPVQSYRGRSLDFSMAASLTAALKKLSNAEGVTLYMTSLAAFKILLWRYSGQGEVVVGTPIAGRNQLATEGLIGLFVNTLVLRTSLSGDPSFRELLDRVKEVTLGAYAHQDLPFEKLVEELQPERDMSRSPLFQVMFVLQNTAAETLQLPRLELIDAGVEDETAKFDLTLALSEINEELNGSLQYNVDLFEASTIRRMLEQFERLLTSAVSAPEQHISQLELLSSAERQQLLVERNDTHIAYPHSRGIHELFEEQVAHAPAAPALTFQGEHLSYAELNSRANQLAHYLRQLGVKADTPVGVCLDRSVEMVVALLAILKAGGVYIPFDPEYPAERLAFIVDDVSPLVILTQSSLVGRLSSTHAQTLCLDTESELWSGLPATDLAGLVSSSANLAYVMYTSGSTGNPKGVAVPHHAVVRLVKQSAYVDFGAGEIFLQLAPVTFDASTLEIWGALLNGGRLVLMPPGSPNLAELGTVLRNEGVTVLWLTAGLFHLMVEHELEALASVTQVVAGGDVLSTEHVRRLLRAKEGSGVVVNGYGPTETTTFACCHRMSSETELDHGVPIGSPIGNTQVYVLGEAMELMGQGMLGELYIGGDGLARGYYNQPGLTADRFVPHPFSTTGGERLYRTGDYVSWGADGKLEFIGRRDTQVKIRGFRVEPGEVEAVLGRHGAVKECAVVVRRETNGEKRIVAYVVDGNHENGVNASELRDYLREQLPEFMLPAAIVAVESLPLTPNGKVDRRELAAREVRAGGDESYVPPRTINEELLCNIWEEVLHAERVGINDNFFDLGGDSILTIKVIVKTRAVGLDVNVQQLFQYQTVHELAQELERSNESPIIVGETAPFSLIGEEDRLRLPAGVVDAYPVTALQAGMLFHTELAPEAGQYHDIFSYHLRMPFDEEALRATLRQLLELHPVLRTSFNLSDFSEPLQLVHEEVAMPLRIEDLRSLTPKEQEEYVAEWLAGEKQRHFDWRKAPLLRFQIGRRDEESFQFSLSFHHAILDGWSLATMLTDLFNVYASVVKGDERRTIAPLNSSFRDFVAAEQRVLNSAEARQYWTTMLGDAPHSRLPRLGQSAGPSRVAGHRVDISSELSLALKALARTAGVPQKSVLLAAHLRASSVLTGSNDVLTGMVSHGRPETADSERVLGLFLNTLPFRRRLAGGTWLQLVQETFAAERELLPFRRYPMARMQRDLGIDTPLFEITFNFVHFHAYEEMQHAGGLEVLSMDGVGDTNFTLAVAFSLELSGSQIELNLHYDAAELSAEQIEAVGRIYLTILENMTRRPLERYEHQSLLSQAERQRILNDWNDTRVAYDSEKCLQQLFEAL